MGSVVREIFGQILLEKRSCCVVIKDRREFELIGCLVNLWSDVLEVESIVCLHEFRNLLGVVQAWLNIDKLGEACAVPENEFIVLALFQNELGLNADRDASQALSVISRGHLLQRHFRVIRCWDDTLLDDCIPVIQMVDNWHVVNRSVKIS